MATETLRLLIESSADVGGFNRAQRAMDEFGDEVRGTSDAMDAQRVSFTELNQAYQLFGEIATQAWEFLGETARRQNITASFQELSREAGLSGAAIRQAMDDAADGTVGLETQLRSANRLLAASFEVSVEDIGSALAIARDRARTFGLTTEEAFDRLIEGATKGSVEMLDELGIIVRTGEATQRYADSIGVAVDELTAGQRQGAIFRQILEDNADVLADNVVESDNLADSMSRVTAAWDDFKGTIQELVSNTPAIQDFFNFIADGLRQAEVGARGVFAGFQALTNMIGVLSDTGDADLAIIAGLDAIEDAAYNAAVATGELDPRGIGQDFIDLGRSLSYGGETAQGFHDQYKALLNELDRSSEEAQALQALYEEFALGNISARDFSTAMEMVINHLGPLGTASDVAAAAQEEFALSFGEVTDAAEQQGEELQSLVETLNDDIASAYQERIAQAESYRDASAQAEQDYQDKVTDIVARGVNARADAQRSYQDKTSDIGVSLNDTLADIMQDSADNRYDIEREYQQQIADLRKSGSKDEQEAIRKRDASALSEAREQAKEELNEAQEAREDDLRQLALNETRKRREAQIQQQRQLRDAQTYLSRKLRDQRIGEQRSLQSALMSMQTEQQRRYQQYQADLTAHQQYLNAMLQQKQRTAAAYNAIQLNTQFAQNAGYTPAYSFKYNTPAPAVETGKIISGARGRQFVR